jgi:collagenase-like PrtC family protease
MKFSIGYQLPDEYDSITDIVEDYHEHIGEIYFSWVGEASGRPPLSQDNAEELVAARQEQEAELKAARQLGIRLVLLFNANCYGDEAISVSFRDKINAVVEHLKSEFDLDCITTTSPFVAKAIKDRFPNMETRASVNMRIGTINGAEYISNYFDGYYMQREYNRDFERINRLRQWCDKKGKTLHLLANSGCMYACSNQTFHDNTVAHQGRLLQMENTDFDASFCWDYMSHSENWACFLQNTWIRPEDISHYESLFDTVKLATRTHTNPRKVLAAYIRQRFDGNLPDLMEPSFSSSFKNHIIDNTRFPLNWFEKSSNCSRNCEQCGYCKAVLKDVLVSVGTLEKA